MKKFFKSAALVAAAMTVSASAFAQSPVGKFSLTPKVALNVSSVTGDHPSSNVYDLFGDKYKADAEYRLGFAAGVEAGYQFTERFALTAGVMYSLQGYAYGQSVETTISDYHYKFEDNSRVNLGYINIPILANVYLCKGLAVKAGIQPGFLVSAKFKNDVTTTAGSTSKTKTDEEDIKEGSETFDFSIPVGLSYEFSNGIMLDGRYNIGVTDVFKNVSGKNSVFQIMVGYKFNL